MSAPPRTNWISLAVLLTLVVGGTQGWSWWQQERQGQALRALSRPGDVTIYTTTTCPYCAQAKVWLTGHQVAWRECNIDLNTECLQTFQARGAPGVPLMHVRGQWHLGFDPAWLTQTLQDPAR